MNLEGDAAGIAALKQIATANKDFLKFLLQEVRTSFEGKVDFKAADGTKYWLVRDPKDASRLTVEKAG